MDKPNPPASETPNMPAIHPVAGMPVSTDSMPASPRGRGGLIGALIVVLVLAAAGGGYWWYQQGSLPVAQTTPTPTPKAVSLDEAQTQLDKVGTSLDTAGTTLTAADAGLADQQGDLSE